MSLGVRYSNRRSAKALGRQAMKSLKRLTYVQGRTHTQTNAHQYTRNTPVPVPTGQCNRVIVVSVHVQCPPSEELSGGAVPHCPCDGVGAVGPAAVASLLGEREAVTRCSSDGSAPYSPSSMSVNHARKCLSASDSEATPDAALQEGGDTSRRQSVGATTVVLTVVDR